MNLLLILGSAILVGGMKYREQAFNTSATELSASLLCLSAFSLLIPVRTVLFYPDKSVPNSALDRFPSHFQKCSQWSQGGFDSQQSLVYSFAAGVPSLPCVPAQVSRLSLCACFASSYR